MIAHASFSMASNPLGPAATVTLQFGSSQATPRVGVGLGLYSVESPAEARMAPLLSLQLGERKSISTSARAAATSTSSKNTNSDDGHALLYVGGAVVVVAVGALLLTARHNSPSTQGSGGTVPVQ
jgi:hypothetical protein